MSLQLYYFPTLNGLKVTIALEELGLAYAIRLVDIFAGEQDGPEFLAINPNGRIPALVDQAAGVTVFESAAILQYLGRKSGGLYPPDEPTRAQIDSWLFWQMAGLGPMSGQVNWFERAAAKPGRDPAATSLPLHRFRKETRRLFAVLERQLAGREFICGAYSLADIACWPWIDRYPANGGTLEPFPHLAAWRRRVSERPAVRRAVEIEDRFSRGLVWTGALPLAGEPRLVP